MINEQLSNYIKQQLEQKVDKDQIKNSLISNGWQAKDIDEVFFTLLNPLAKQQPIPQPIPQPPVIVTSLPNAIELFKQSLLIYKQKLGIFLGIASITILLPTLMGEILDNIPPASSNYFKLFLVLLTPITIVLTFWGSVALLYAIKNHNEKIGLLELFKQAKHKLNSYFKIIGWQFTLVLGGLFLLIIPGIIFSIWYCLAEFTLVFEELKVKDALLKSREYIKNHFAEVFWRLLFLSIIGILISQIPYLINLFIPTPLIFKINVYIFSILLNPLRIIYLFLIYQNLKKHKR